jgi:hypothetical protein
VRRAYGLADGDIARLWAQLLSGQSGARARATGGGTGHTVAEAAWSRLKELRAAFVRLDLLAALEEVVAVAGGERPPQSQVELAALKGGVCSDRNLSPSAPTHPWSGSRTPAPGCERQRERHAGDGREGFEVRHRPKFPFSIALMHDREEAHRPLPAGIYVSQATGGLLNEKRFFTQPCGDGVRANPLR